MPQINWAALLRAAVQGGRMQPTDFWSLTPVELMMILGREQAQPLQRAGLDALLKAFPDMEEGHSE